MGASANSCASARNYFAKHMDHGDFAYRQLRKNSKLCNCDGCYFLDADSRLFICAAPARRCSAGIPHAWASVHDSYLLPDLRRCGRQYFLYVSGQQFPGSGNPGDWHSYVLHLEVDLTPMIYTRSTAFSPYMEWAKLHSVARHNLATSGMVSLPLAELDV